MIPKMIGKCIIATSASGNGKIIISHQDGTWCHFPRAHFEAAVAPLDQLTEQHAEAVEAYFGENF